MQELLLAVKTLWCSGGEIALHSNWPYMSRVGAFTTCSVDQIVGRREK
jgi:hypothetical protein